MSTPLTVSVPHRLGQDEAVRRLKSGLESARRQFGAVMTVAQEDWDGNRCTFRISAIGQQASGVITVEPAEVRLEVQLPWLLARLADKVRGTIAKQGHLMLDKPKADA